MNAQNFISVELSTGIPLVNYRLDPKTLREIFNSYVTFNLKMERFEESISKSLQTFLRGYGGAG
jgi:hypothetical protein